MEKTCTGCVVSAGTHKPADALQQIDEPQADATRGNTAGGVRCHDADACAMGQLSCPTPVACGCAAAPQEEAIAEIVSASHDQAEFGERGINFLRDFQHLEYGTKLYPAAQAVHQIAEPAAPVGKPIKDAIDALVWAAFTEGGCSEHRMSEARIQTELRKKELCTLIADTQPAAQGMDAQDDTALLNFLQTESWDLRCFDAPTGAGDGEIHWKVIEHHMAAPHEREVGRAYSDDPREAIRNAIGNATNIAAQAKQDGAA